VLRRFENTGVRDQIARLSIDGTAKFPSFLIPTIETQLSGGWARRPRRARARGVEPLPRDGAGHRDSHGANAVSLAHDACTIRRCISNCGRVFTKALRESRIFRNAFVAMSHELAARDPISVIERVVGAT
jgi:mannitol 2-dehydrogenase